LEFIAWAPAIFVALIGCSGLLAKINSFPKPISTLFGDGCSAPISFFLSLDHDRLKFACRADEILLATADSEAIICYLKLLFD